MTAASVRAHQHQLCAERLHHVELALGAVEVAPERARRAFEIAEWLVQLAGEAEVRSHCPTAAGDPLQ